MTSVRAARADRVAEVLGTDTNRRASEATEAYLLRAHGIAEPDWSLFWNSRSQRLKWDRLKARLPYWINDRLRDYLAAELWDRTESDLRFATKLFAVRMQQPDGPHGEDPYGAGDYQSPLKVLLLLRRARAYSGGLDGRGEKSQRRFVAAAKKALVSYLKSEPRRSRGLPVIGAAAAAVVRSVAADLVNPGVARHRSDRIRNAVRGEMERRDRARAGASDEFDPEWGNTVEGKLWSEAVRYLTWLSLLPRPQRSRGRPRYRPESWELPPYGDGTRPKTAKEAERRAKRWFRSMRGYAPGRPRTEEFLRHDSSREKARAVGVVDGIRKAKNVAPWAAFSPYTMSRIMRSNSKIRVAVDPRTLRRMLNQKESATSVRNKSVPLSVEETELAAPGLPEASTDRQEVPVFPRASSRKARQKSLWKAEQVPSRSAAPPSTSGQ